MNQRHHVRIGLAGLAMAALTGTTLAAAPATATTAMTERAQGDRSLATVLMMDKGFDRNWHDFDIVEKAVMKVLAAKPDSPVGVLADGSTRLTAFVPKDVAFLRLVRDLTGRTPKTERGTFRALLRVADVDTLEAVLLYHVVPGKTLRSGKVATLDGASLTTAGGGTITVRVRDGKVFLVDQDRNDRNPRVVVVDINKGNKQIGHGINRVLRPMDL
ncbi:MAG TPA: fasciclin domain-containing protein [Nocardioides sp.]|uniref:fasciclin domain-containing protein n=1 Tax=Nocardioides sp. TaxID=35761 RepID=UPI002ED84359